MKKGEERGKGQQCTHTDSLTIPEPPKQTQLDDAKVFL